MYFFWCSALSGMYDQLKVQNNLQKKVQQGFYSGIEYKLSVIFIYLWKCTLFGCSKMMHVVKNNWNWKAGQKEIGS